MWILLKYRKSLNNFDGLIYGFFRQNGLLRCSCNCPLEHSFIPQRSRLEVCDYFCSWMEVYLSPSHKLKYRVSTSLLKTRDLSYQEPQELNTRQCHKNYKSNPAYLSGILPNQNQPSKYIHFRPSEHSLVSSLCGRFDYYEGSQVRAQFERKWT